MKKLLAIAVAAVFTLGATLSDAVEVTRSDEVRTDPTVKQNVRKAKKKVKRGAKKAKKRTRSAAHTAKRKTEAAADRTRDSVNR
jgi:hypothetical protein